MEAVEGILKSIETDARRNLDGQLDLFSVMSGEAQSGASEDNYEIKQLPEYSHKELLQQEKEAAACICPVIRWMLTGNNRHALHPTPSRILQGKMPM